ncbi:ATP-dependent DNA ligase [Effusibacillus pohliae]|uniref:ATP-dependent DNA ligase n=1 Tax=Effusibacillus pohliae TaxID=232270 RepID=UPI0003760451|nr:RNA ligase family protein [Effusibacillus pohliae]
MKPIVPMEPKSSKTIPGGKEWIAQVKWDGVRLLAYYDGKQVRLYNRKRNERTFHYPELTDIRRYCSAQSVILDGEVISLGADGKPSFREVMRRDGIRRLEKVAQVRKAVPVTYMIFDLIHYNGEWVDRRPFRERTELLASIITPGRHVQLVDSHNDGQTLFDVIRQHGMEGIVVKKTASLYAIGETSDAWLKVKNYRDLIAVIGGFTLNGGTVNAVLLGLYDEAGQLWYIGHTGTGKLSHEDWRKLTERLQRLTTRERPFVNLPERHADAHWVRPRLTAKVQFAEWTEGGCLRHPSIQAFVDAPPEACIFGQSG